MKSTKVLILCFIILVISSNSYTQEDIPSNWSYTSISSPLDVQFINQTTGFVAVRNGANIDVKKTTNYGASWTSFSSRGVSFLSKGTPETITKFFECQ
jgi:hypothetical protein